MIHALHGKKAKAAIPSSNEEIKLIPLFIVELHLTEGISQLVVENGKFLRREGFRVNFGLGYA